MELFDLTHSPIERIILRKESRVFFVWNQSKNISIELDGPAIEAHIFALFIGNNTSSFDLKFSQTHQAPDTRSHLTALSILSGSASISYRGVIRIDERAPFSDASQENRNVLISKNTRATSEPILEILSDSGTARHASTTANPSAESLEFLALRGIGQEIGTKTLSEGLIRSFFEKIHLLTKDPILDKYEETALTELQRIDL